MSKETKELALEKISSMALAAAGSLAAASPNQFAYEGDPDDLLIPRLLVGQSMSEVVQKELISVGTIYRSTTKEGVGGKGKPFLIIPLALTKTWVLTHRKPPATKFEFLRIEAHTASNKDSDWEWSEGGVDYKRTKSLNFFCLLPSDIDKDAMSKKAFTDNGEIPDLDDALLPCMLSFQSTSYKEGKRLTTHFALAGEAGLPPFINSFAIDSEMKENALGRYYVLKVSKGGKTESAQLPVCRKWYDLVATQNLKVDEDHDVAVVSGDTVPASGQTEF